MLNSAQFNMSRIVGPTLGGYSMALFGMAGNFFLNGLSFLAMLFALTQIKYPEPEQRRHLGFMASLREGFGYMRGRSQMLVMAGMVAVSSFLVFPFITFIPYFARMQLHVGETGLGWLMAASGLGAVLGAVTVAARGTLRHRGQVLTIAGLVFFTSVIGLCLSHTFWLSQCFVLVEGYFSMVMISSFNVAMQHLCSDEMRGRVLSIYSTCFLGLPPIGALLVGEMSRHVETGYVLAAMAATASVLYAGFYMFSRPLRELD